MPKPFHDILHPPEVQGRQLRRYWIAVAGWFVLMLLGILLLGGLVLIAVYLLESRFGTTALDPYEMWIFGGMLVSGGLGIFLGDWIWRRLFVKTGYLSREAVIRIRTNRAPTTRGERIHRRLSLSLSLLIPVFLVWVGWYLDSDWMMGLMALLGVWLFVSVRAGWKKVDAMSTGKEPMPQRLERVADDLDETTRVSRNGSAD